MKRNIWIHHLLGAGFAFLLSVSVGGCVATGFDLSVTMERLIWWCGILSLVCALLCRAKYGGSLILCLAMILLGHLWNHSPLWDQIQTLLHRMTGSYHRAYDWPLLGQRLTDEVDLALMVLSGWTLASVCFCFCRRKHVIFALPSIILPLVLCLIVTNTVPDEIYLYLLIFGTAMLLLTDWVRRHYSIQGMKLVFRMAIPVGAALAMLFYLNPQDGYVNNAKNLQEEMVSWFQNVQEKAEEVAGSVVSEAAISQRLNLRTLGPKSTLSFPVMRVTSPIDGTLYLRGQDFDVYTGEGWTASLDRTETFLPGSSSTGELTIITYSARSIRYVPYYTTEPILLTDGCVDNDENLTSYRYALATSTPHGTPTPDSRYTELPADTLIWAGVLAEELTAGCVTQAEAIEAIRVYVRNSAPYDKNTPRMDRSFQDFAQWFLEESETGYCVHFATAATVLLRAAGIPARYVEGYMFSGVADEEVVVSNQAAHAWAEYYDFNASAWRVLEATPPDETSEEETTVPTSTESISTESPETQTAETTPIQIEPTQIRPTGGTAGHNPQHSSIKLPEWAKTLGWLMLSLAVFLLHGELRIHWKRKLWNQGTPNQMALMRWRQSCNLARVLKMPMPDSLEILAQKAKFSQHTLTREELQQFDLFRRDAFQQLTDKPWYLRWILRWVLAIG